MSLASLFDSGNRGNRSTCNAVTATGRATQGGNQGNRGNRVFNSINFKILLVTCYTPNGEAIQIEARDQDHAQWLQKMNPKPTSEVSL